MMGGHLVKVTESNSTDVSTHRRRKRLCFWCIGLGIAKIASAAIGGSGHNKASCFPGSSMVTLQSGQQIPMSQVQIGDVVLAAPGVYSQVYLFDHKVSDIQAEFVQLNLQDGFTIKLTAKHYIQLESGLTTAESVQVGDKVLSSKGVYKTVESISIVQDKGLYNPYTLAGTIVVDGVVASSYTADIHPRIQQALYTPVKWVYQMTGVNILGSSLEDMARPWWASLLEMMIPQGPSVLESSSNMFFQVFQKEL
jgi:preprotein translocase subunit YajC